jgi:hybrid cluster-associated redox disulfide protein
MPDTSLDDPNLSIADLLARWPRAVTAFALYRMACPGCPISRFHTVQDACLEYDADEKLFRAELHKAVSPMR